MKVLFAVSNENISDSIVKKYQKEYKEIISYKNVYYFNAIQKEIQRDKTYDRIIISEDLEPFANNDYEAIDRFIFEKLDSISDEATDSKGEDTPVILICSDRRAKSEQLLVKLFGIGIYNALLGQDRSIDEVCKLINRPRTKKEAKIYYKIESDDVNYHSEAEDTVSEVEIQNIRAHYRKLGKNEEAYVESFNNIASQYTDAQLKVIVKLLPINVRAVLERDSLKYQQVMAFSGQPAIKQTTTKSQKKEDAIKIDFIENQLNKQKPKKPVIVPSVVNAKNVKKLSTNQEETKRPEKKETIEAAKPEVTPVNIFELDEEQTVATPPKRGRGRPKKVVSEEEQLKVETPKRGRGRPKKVIAEPIVEELENINLFDLDEEEKQNTATVLPGFDEVSSSGNEMPNTVLPGLDDVEEIKDEDVEVLPVFDEEEQRTNMVQEPEYGNNMMKLNGAPYNQSETNKINDIIKTNTQSPSIESLLTHDKKIVSFVGTSKNGTSFLINNLAELFSSMGINTAILDMTKNKNSYYIYTKNEEPIRKIAYECMGKLENGIAEGIKVNNKLTVYTSLPTEPVNPNPQVILSTLVKNYSLVLIDTDFDTPYTYFENSQEIYLVQSMDILTIQPLTAFLRDLKAKNILVPEKLKIVVNKVTKVRGINSKVIVGGMAFYNDPSMSYMTELFNKDTIKYTSMPFSVEVYSRYLEGLVNCKVSLNGYDKNFINSLKELGSMVYPLLSNKYKPVDNYQTKPAFSSKMDSTLEQMKKNF